MFILDFVFYLFSKRQERGWAHFALVHMPGKCFMDPIVICFLFSSCTVRSQLLKQFLFQQFPSLVISNILFVVVEFVGFYVGFLVVFCCFCLLLKYGISVKLASRV